MTSPKSDKNSVRRILVVDDHPIVASGIRGLLDGEPDLAVCAEAATLADALKAIEEHKPHAAVIDITLKKGRDGLELTKTIRAQKNEMPILIMSMHDESLYAQRALRAGANGYIMKHEVADKVVEALRTVLSGEVFVNAKIQQDILAGVGGRSFAPDASPLERLTDRELEVFRLIGKGKSTRQIAEMLHLSVKTIESHRAHIKEKFGISSSVELVRDAVQWAEGENTA